MQKKVLIISYYWPPAGGPGVQRWLKLSKYLSKSGVQVYVLTVDPNKATYPLQDKSLEKDIASGISVFYTDTSEQFGMYKKASGKKNVPYSGFASEEKNPSFKDKVARFARGNFFIPDARKGWNKHAINKAIKLIDKEGISNIITTSPPHSTQLIGLAIKRLRNVNWLADFRDPWTDIYYYDLFYPTYLARKWDKKLEKNVLESADTVLVAAPGFKDLFLSKDASYNPDKFKVVTNGYDAEDFKNLPEVKKEKVSSVYTITYIGTITKQYKIKSFLDALSTLDKNVCLKIVGKWDSDTEALIKSKDYSFECEFVDYVPKSTLPLVMQNSNALLIALPQIELERTPIPGKIFDYLAANKPIIGVGNVLSDTAKILEETQAGKMLNPDDSHGFLSYLKKITQEHYQYVRDNTLVQNYSRQKQAAYIESILL